jgi:hypothetical protein
LIIDFRKRFLKLAFLDKTEFPNLNIEQLKASGGCKSYDRQKHAIKKASVGRFDLIRAYSGGITFEENLV